MLLVDHPEGKVAVAQPAHAWISGQLARAWADVSPREEVCLAAEQHDIPWLEWEREPSYDPETGYPYTFMSLDMPTKLAMWETGPDLLLAHSRYAALLVSMHGTALYERFPPPEDPGGIVQKFLDEQREFQASLSGGLDPDELRRNQKLVFAWDYISLALCLDWAPTEVEDVLTADGTPITLALSEEAELDPWPFREDRVDLRTEGRRLEDSSLVTLEFTLRPRR